MPLCRVKHRAGSSPSRRMPGVGGCSGRLGPAKIGLHQAVKLHQAVSGACCAGTFGRLRFAAVRAVFCRDGAGEFARRDSPSNIYCHGLRRKLGGESGHHCRILRFRRRSCDAVVVMPDAQPSHQHYCVRDICVGRSVSTSSHHALLLLHSIGWRGTVGKLSFRFSAERTKRKTHPQEAGPNPNQHETLCSQQ